MTPIRTDEVWRLATARWAEIARNFPDLEPALALQQRLLRILLDASVRLEDGRPAEPTTGSDVIFAKWVRGVPALRNEVTPIPPALKATLPQLCAALVEGGAGDAAAH